MKTAALILLLLVLFVANILVGSVSIPLSETLRIVTGQGSANAAWEYIILQSRLPQAITATLAGASLATSGLILQTTFRNPLAGPSVFGISSGASLAVALVMLLPTTSALSASLNTVTALSAAFIGAILVIALIIGFAQLVRSNVMLLIIGIMVGYLANSAITLLNFFATEQGVHNYTIWGMGNLGGVTLAQIPLFALLNLIGIGATIMLAKPLNALLLGEQYAQNLGVHIGRTRNLLLVITGLLTATTTAYCGPISFLGLATPHLTRLLLPTQNHRTLIPATILTGACITLLCNLVCTLPGESGIIPINAITPLVAAPIIIYIILKKQ